MKRCLVILLVIAAATAEAAQRRRAAPPADPSLPAVWVWNNAHVLQSTAWPAPAADLEPLREIVGEAQVVGLGDGTHGTREFYTTKLRIIDFLVREMGFDVVAFEAPFPLFDRLNEYVRTGVGDPRTLLIEGDERLFYRFWRVEEMLDVVEWMRAYNVERGENAVEIAGTDVYDGEGAAAAVVKYLFTVDADLASTAQADYACVQSFHPLNGCLERALGVRETLAGRRGHLEAISGRNAFEEALQNARIAEQSQMSIIDRDPNMAANTRWLLDQRSESKRIIYWAHQEHVGKTGSPWVAGGLSAGWHLARDLGPRYVAIGSLTGGGTVRHWTPPAGISYLSNVPAPAAGSYESYFRLRPAAAILIPLHRSLPSWLLGPAPCFGTGTAPSGEDHRLSVPLPAKLDAVLYVDQTTPTTPLQ
ncbi:MAG TPA: erythromycin esterase family protein [Thermoanaerobaculia bacterium]|nr:erythromycin esterase family protein [Thermoanaerobaculia bacterium]